MTCYKKIIFLLLLNIFLLHSNSEILTSEEYHPENCTVLRYEFAFIKDKNVYKIHGLWPDICQECTGCGYPTCCDMELFSNFTMPADIKFIKENWFEGDETHKAIACDTIKTTTLLEHEVLKHGSCMHLYSDEYVDIVKMLFLKYQDHIYKVCKERHCSFNLKQDFSLDDNPI